MGFDKPDLGFVVHFQRPGSAIAYYQQVGRAGRAVENAFGVVLSGREDDDIADYFIATAFPPTRRWGSSTRSSQGSTCIARTAVNLRRGRIEMALKLLEIDGAVARVGSRYVRTPIAWEQDEAWVAGVIEARRRELASMRAYVETDTCRMRFLGELLNDPTAADCGHCANDGGVRWPRSSRRHSSRMRSRTCGATSGRSSRASSGRKAHASRSRPPRGSERSRPTSSPSVGQQADGTDAEDGEGGGFLIQLNQTKLYSA